VTNESEAGEGLTEQRSEGRREPNRKEDEPQFTLKQITDRRSSKKKGRVRYSSS